MHVKLILIRHGETDWSRSRKYCGFSDIPLNRNGKEQARRFCRILKEEKVHKVYSSDMKRALQFAKIIFKDMPVECLPELREINFGIFEGLTYHEIMKRYPAIYTRWINKPFAVSIPGGESLRDLDRRVKRALERILSSSHTKTVVIFTHAGPIRIILGDILKFKPRKIWKIEQDLANMSVIEFINGRGNVRLLKGIRILNE